LDNFATLATEFCELARGILKNLPRKDVGPIDQLGYCDKL